MTTTARDEGDALAALINARCRLSGEFTLRSGRVATEYFDKYLFESDPVLLRQVVARMAALVPDDAQLLGGLELGGVPIATLLGQVTGLPVLFIRKQAKEYGTRRLAEGGDPTGRNVVVVEDVVTSGGAVLEGARALRRLGATVTTAVCAIDRAEGGAEALAAEQVELRAALTRSDLDAAVGL